MSQFAWGRVRWSNSIFLIGTLVLALTGTPIYLWHFGISATQVMLFLFFFAATGLSITLGYHRLYSHLTFKAGWPVRLLTLLFGAAAFENSALIWAADHRRHHRFVDHDEDPYDISKGFFHAHIGWILFRYPPDTSLVWAKDLQKDRLVVWQHRYYVPLAIVVGFLLPTFLGWVTGGGPGAIGGFLLAGVTRVVLVHHMTFFINSLCHTVGRQPYSSRCTARDSALMAWLTFGEGYHNFHHEFQHDYRNGVRPWDFDPTKWCIWLLRQLGLVKQLRRVPYEKILLARVAEQERQLVAALSATGTPVPDHVRQLLDAARLILRQTAAHWEEGKTEYQRIMETGMGASREKLVQLRQEVREAAARFREAVRTWHHARRLVQMHVE
ncbi:MAG: acyl-CoA desaturase [Verrucomicrobiia bacterium]